jgi:hypothetical protein
MYYSANAGAWTVTATVNGLSDTASLVVNHGPALSVVLSPTYASIVAGSNQAFTATATDSYGNHWDITSLATWSIDSNAAGSWNSNVYTSAKAGTWIVTAEYSSRSSTASITVNHAAHNSISLGVSSSSITAGSQATFTAIASDIYGNTWDVSSLVVWSIDSDAEGSWNNNVYTSSLSGTWTVTGTLGDQSKSVFLTVLHASATDILVNPYDTIINAGSSQTYIATAVDNFGNRWDGTSSTTWSINPDAGGSWLNNVYTSAKAGTWTVTATVASLIGTTPLTVNHASATSLTISPKSAVFQAGSSQAFTATAHDFYGNSWDVSNLVVWSITPNAGGSWSGNFYTCGTTGSWTITGILDSLSDTGPLTVNHGPVLSISISPESESITSGSNQAYNAIASDTSGNIWDVTDSTSWFINTGAGGSWSGNVYTSSNTGTWTVTGTYAGVSDTAQLNVSGGITQQFSPFDINHDGTVNFADLALFVHAYNEYAQNRTVDVACDYNQDGAINFADLAFYIHGYINYP